MINDDTVSSQDKLLIHEVLCEVQALTGLDIRSITTEDGEFYKVITQDAQGNEHENLWKLTPHGSLTIFSSQDKSPTRES